MQPYTFSKQDEEREETKYYQSIYSKYVEFYHNEIFKNQKQGKEYIKKSLTK